MWIVHSRVCIQSGIQSGVYHNHILAGRVSQY